MIVVSQYKDMKSNGGQGQNGIALQGPQIRGGSKALVIVINKFNGILIFYNSKCL